MKYNLLKTEELLRKELTEKRFRHTQGVQYTAACLAMKYGECLESAILAGLLHDCAKCIPDEKQLEKCLKYNIPVTITERESPYLLHAKLGAYYAKNKYNIEEPEILSAITWHTTGRPQMTQLEMIVFIADYIEPNRKIIPEIELIRKTAFEDLELTMELILKSTLDYLQKDGKQIDSATMEAYKYYRKK